MQRWEDAQADPESFNWIQLGICNSSDLEPADFYEKYESSPGHAAIIDEMCIACPVIKTCAQNGLSGREFGVWGAVYWDGAGHPSELPNAHKTKDVWERIARRMK